MSDGADDRGGPSMPEPPDRGSPPESEEPAAEPERTDRRPRLLPVWILLAGAAASGSAWAVMDHLVNDEPAEQVRVKLITASTEPYKVRPDDPGGLEIPDRDKLIYETLTTAEPEEAPEQILPPPEEPVSPPHPVAEVAAEAAEAPELGQEAAVPPEPEEPEAAPVPIAEETPRVPIPVLRSVIRAGDAGSVEAPAKGEEAGRVPMPAEKPIWFARAETPSRVTVAAPREPALSAAASRFMIQLGASRARRTLESQWEALWRRHETALERLNPVIVRTDRGDEGIWYRLRAGPFSGRAAAFGACERLKARGIDCLVVVN